MREDIGVVGSISSLIAALNNRNDTPPIIVVGTEMYRRGTDEGLIVNGRFNGYDVHIDEPFMEDEKPPTPKEHGWYRQFEKKKRGRHRWQRDMTKSS
jgi:hypothetical protein